MKDTESPIYEVKFYSEICCEHCNEIIHNHFECPVCLDDYAGTDIYGELWFTDSFSCEECNANFKSVDGNLKYDKVNNVIKV